MCHCGSDESTCRRDQHLDLHIQWYGCEPVRMATRVVLLSCPLVRIRTRSAGACAGMHSKRQDCNGQTLTHVHALTSVAGQQGDSAGCVRECCAEVLAWSHAEDTWKARASVVTFVPFARKPELYPTFRQDLLQAAAVTVQHPNRFVQLGTGMPISAMAVHLTADDLMPHALVLHVAPTE